MKYRTRTPLVIALLWMGILLAPGPAAATIFYDFHQVNTSVGFGLFTPPAWIGPPRYLAASGRGTPLSVDLVDRIATTYPGIAGSSWEAPLRDLGTMDNLTFLTSGLVQTRNAGQLLVETLNTLLADLEAAHPGVVFTATGPAGTYTYLDTRKYALFGGVLDAGSTVVCRDESCLPNLPAGDYTVVFGDADVDFYRVELSVTAPAPSPVPEPGTGMLLGAGLAALGLLFGLRRAGA